MRRRTDRKIQFSSFFFLIKSITLDQVKEQELQMKIFVVIRQLIFYLIHLLFSLNTHFFVHFQLFVFEVHQFVVQNEDVELLVDVFLIKTKIDHYQYKNNIHFVQKIVKKILKQM